MNPPNNHHSAFYGDPNIDAVRSSFSPHSANYPENRRKFSPHQSSTPKTKHHYKDNTSTPLNLSCRSADSSYDYHSPFPSRSPAAAGFPAKFRPNRNHSYSHQSSPSCNDSSSSHQFYNPSFNYRNKHKRDSSSSFNVEDYYSPEMLEDPWADLIADSTTPEPPTSAVE